MSSPFRPTLRSQRPLHSLLSRQRCIFTRTSERLLLRRSEDHDVRRPLVQAQSRSRPHGAIDRCHLRNYSQSTPSSARATNASQVELTIDGQRHAFSPVLLRDRCACPQCLDPSTLQKFRPTTDIPSKISPRDVLQTQDGVRIFWENDVQGYGTDHATDIPASVLSEYVQLGQTGLANSNSKLAAGNQRVLWNASQYRRLPDISYDEYMQSDASLYRILQQLHSHGLAFVTGVPEDENSVINVANRIGPIKNTFYGYTWDVRSVPDSKNVAYTSQDLGFHMDLLYMEQPPHLQFLHCIRSSSVGGASLFTDSFRAAADLLEMDVDAFDVLRSCPIDYHYNHPSSALYYQRRPVLEFSDPNFRGGVREMTKEYRASQQDRFAQGAASPMDHLAHVSWSPPFQAPMGAQPLSNEGQAPLPYANDAVNKWHGAAQKFNTLIHRPEHIYERLMKPGECVLFDNRRVLHARKAFEVGDAGKERWLRGTYVDLDPYLSKMRVLEAALSAQRQDVDDGDRETAAAS